MKRMKLSQMKYVALFFLSAAALMAQQPGTQCYEPAAGAARHGVATCFPDSAFVLTYYCDGETKTCANHVGRYRAFASVQEAVGWIELHYRYRPGVLTHGDDEYDIRITYLYPDSDDQDRRLMKSVEFLTQEEVDDGCGAIVCPDASGGAVDGGTGRER